MVRHHSARPCASTSVQGAHHERQSQISERHGARRRSRRAAAAELAQGLRRRLAPRHPRADARDQPVRHAGGVGRGEESADLRLRHVGPVHRPGRRRSTSARACRRCARAGSRSATTPSELDGPSSRYGQERLADPEARDAALQPAAQAAPREARHERDADALRAQRHHHAGDGVHRDPRDAAPRCAARSRDAAAPRRELRRGDSRR